MGHIFEGNDEKFKELVESCLVYGEYGCGLSTQWVAKGTSAYIYSVDSSSKWIETVKHKVGVRDGLFMRHVNLGELGHWGRPLSYAKRDNFSEYTDWLWQQDRKPDVILIDGRFRVACFLTSLLHAEPNAKIVFDDYLHRPEYYIVEEFADKPEFSGRQAIFVVPKLDADQKQSVVETLEKFRYVMD